MRCIAQKTFLSIVVLLCLLNPVCAQFAPAAHLPGTTAIPADSSIFTDWAAGCSILRGPMNIVNPSLGLASAGDSLAAMGPADDGAVSLGDGGTATLTFHRPVFNGIGSDFAVFENGFMTNDSNLAFLELAFVEVSTDGRRFVRFPATTKVQDTSQLNNDGSIDCSQINNFAGKYIARFGTPFDLEELVDSPGIDVNNINYIRVVDVVGSLDSAYASFDHLGNMVNDPWPTPFASCGFDLDAVGIIHSLGANGIFSVISDVVKSSPNPVKHGENLQIVFPESISHLEVYNVAGQNLFQWSGEGLFQFTTTANFSSGIYFVCAAGTSLHFNAKLIVE